MESYVTREFSSGSDCRVRWTLCFESLTLSSLGQDTGTFAAVEATQRSSAALPACFTAALETCGRGSTIGGSGSISSAPSRVSTPRRPFQRSLAWYAAMSTSNVAPLNESV